MASHETDLPEPPERIDTSHDRLPEAELLPEENDQSRPSIVAGKSTLQITGLSLFLSPFAPLDVLSKIQK